MTDSSSASLYSESEISNFENIESDKGSLSPVASDEWTKLDTFQMAK